MRSHWCDRLIGFVAGAALVSAAPLSPTWVFAQQASAPPAASDTLIPRYRLRLLGVYDADSGNGLENVEVSNVQTGVTSLTNKSGMVALLFLPEGGGLVRIRKVGYAPVTRFVAISPNDTAPVTEVLTRTVPTLPTVTTQDSSVKYISPGLQGFEQRRHGGFGHFIAEAELRKNDEMAFKNVVSKFPGLTISCEPISNRGVARRTGCYAITTRMVGRLVLTPGACYVSIYLDGNPMQGLEDTDLNKFKTDEYAGVEYYSGPSEIPPQYNTTGNACGVLLLWSRER